MSVKSVFSAAIHRGMFPGARGDSKLELDDGRISRLRAIWPVFVAQAARVGVSPYLLAGIAWGESDFIPTARNSSSGAAGLMQVMPGNFSKLGWTGDDWTIPAKNVAAGADILSYQVKARGSVVKGLAGYGGFATWLSGAAVTPGGDKDATWYIDEALGRAFVIEFFHKTGGLQLD